LSTNTPEYDYIIAGAGCAGLSLLMHIVRSEKFQDKRILVVDKTQKNQNDRTWCFWELNDGMFEEIVYSRWDQLRFFSDDVSRLMDISPYKYKLIRGIDFYKFCFGAIGKEPNIEVVYGTVTDIISNGSETSLRVDGRKISARYIFNSIRQEPAPPKKGQYDLLQHFKGWVVNTAQPVFDTAAATLMDFRIDQSQGTAFVYVMPFTPNSALVEYTLFTGQLLEREAYDAALRQYLRDYLHLDNYSVSEEEFGIIPMTNYRFPVADNNIIYLGTAGGQTKGSSGYTFQFIQKHSAAIVKELTTNEQVLNAPDVSSRKFRFYDSVLLHVLANDLLPGSKVFSDIFRKNKPVDILQFLDNESSLAQDVRIITSLPTLPFLKAALKQ
jgi:lycopene beta-cyclase